MGVLAGGTFFAALLAAAPGASAVKTVHLKGHTKQSNYDVVYPQVGQPKIDGEIARWAKKKVAGFQAAARAPDPHDGPYGMEIAFAVERNDAKMFEVTFREEDSGWGVHNAHQGVSFNYLMPDGWRVYLPEILDAGALGKISALAIADLKERQQVKGDDLRAGWITTGAAARWKNFEDFTLLPNALIVRFAEFQVADYASGPQESKLPFTPLKSHVRDDWRAPVASFDCSAAKTAIERTICSDLELARLDRQVRDAYLFQVDLYQKADERERLHLMQREWVARRDAACGSRPSGEAVACLTGLYRDRLKVLNTRGP